VRYDGKDKLSRHPVLARWAEEGRLVGVCPEVAGGLPVPRPRAELQPDGTVRDEHGVDRSQAFTRGAQAALALAQAEHIRLAVLKEGSPSCGSAEVADGHFRGQRIAGEGRTTQLLRAHGLVVFSEATLDEADAWLRAHEGSSHF
jgi:uncharacterized protein YbbK (DUF523 family)